MADSDRVTSAGADALSVVERTDTPGRVTEQLQIREAGQSSPTDDEVQYPSRFKQLSALFAVITCSLVFGLDSTIVAVAVPSLTDEFKTVRDIGWYQATFGIVAASFIFFYGKVYTVFKVKTVFLLSVAIFELGSLLCTVAPVSGIFILGRAISGLGAAGLAGGIFQILAKAYPPSKRPLVFSIVGMTEIGARISAPTIGGALIDALSWRACFGINLPVGAATVVVTWFGFQDPTPNQSTNLTIKQLLKKANLLSTVIMLPTVASFILALQWGGITYPWSNVRVIALLCISASLFVLFVYVQHRQKDDALIPLRILKNRSVLAGGWFIICTGGCTTVVQSYISIYFQGVKGFTAARAGVLIIPMLAGTAVSTLLCGIGTSYVGYYAPFMVASTIITPVAAGLLTTVNLDQSLAKVLGYLALLGFGAGLGMQGPMNAVNAVLPTKDLPFGTSILQFAGGIGSALFVVASAALFQSRLKTELRDFAPRLNATSIEDAGLSDLRGLVGSDRLQELLFGYDNAIVQTLYLPVGLACATILGSFLVEWRSVKKKQS